MAIELAEENIPELDLAEVLHTQSSVDKASLARLKNILRDDLALERIAEHHSSVLVRMMAGRLRRLMQTNQQLAQDALHKTAASDSTNG